ncbi:MAG: MnhB domain-containing protein [bacterium]|nr:MnhB domain-containing protein [bacterium]MXZ30672.1 hypothetical protein [Acidimicrobiia bacterium]
MIAARSAIIRLGIGAVSPFAVVVGCYLLFAGHNNPGGGFAAGLVFGAVFALRTIAGLHRPAHGIAWVAVGALLVAAVSVLPLLWRDVLLDQYVLAAELPLLGAVKAGTALIFDLGVAAIVIGVVLAVLDGLGATELATDQTPPARRSVPE